MAPESKIRQLLTRLGPSLVLLLPLLTSLLLILSYPKFDQGWLAWFAVAPLVLSIWRAKSAWLSLFQGLAAGFFFYLGILYWIYPTMRAGEVNVPVSLAGWAALSLVLSVEFALVSVFGFYLKKAGRTAWPWVFAAGWTLMEWGKILMTNSGVWFPWFMLGYTQWKYPALVQIVSVTGVYGLSFALCFSGALIGCALLPDVRPWSRVRGAAAALLLAGGLAAFGVSELRRADATAPGEYVPVALLQPSIDLYRKWDDRYTNWIEERLEGTLAMAREPRLIVWPENALPGWIDEPDCRSWLKKAASRPGAFSIAGSVSQGDGRHVAAYLLDPKGEIADHYYKRRLVPFGEYVPLRGLLGRYIGVISELGEFDPGTLAQGIFSAGGIKIGTGICYESVFPYLAGSDAAKGAQLLVNITNDGWYLDTAAPYQHFLVNVFRAAENRRPLVRAANNGISGLIDPWGRVLARTALNEYTALNVKVPLYQDPGRTFYARNGDLLCWFCLMAAVAFLMAVIFV